MACYADQLLAPAEGFGRGFFSGQKRANYDVVPISGHFACLVVTLVTFSRNINNFEEKKKN